MLIFTEKTMESIIDNLKKIEIEVEGKNLQVFDRFPDFIPFVGEEYDSGKHKKLLLIWESYYDTTKPVREIIKCTDSWYFDAKKEEIKEVFGKKTNDYERSWNFASKMHKEGKDRLFKWKKKKRTKIPNWTFQNVEMVLNEKTKEQDKNSFKYCAGYNYYLRPASNSSSIKSKNLDEEVARKTLKKIIDILEPDIVVFFSKKANASFNLRNNNVTFEAFVHPACAWWNKEYGKKSDRANGKKRFEEFIKNLYQ